MTTEPRPNPQDDPLIRALRALLQNNAKTLREETQAFMRNSDNLQDEIIALCNEYLIANKAHSLPQVIAALIHATANVIGQFNHDDVRGVLKMCRLASRELEEHAILSMMALHCTQHHKSSPHAKPSDEEKKQS